MTRRTAAWVAWPLFLLAVVSAAGTAGLTLDESGTGDERLVVPILGFATVGTLVAAGHFSGRPRPEVDPPSVSRSLRATARPR